jgi:hypothetical protein
VEIYSIAIGDLTDTKGLETMRKLASHNANEQHFFIISTGESVFKLVMSSMINKGKRRYVVFLYITLFTNSFINQMDQTSSILI